MNKLDLSYSGGHPLSLDDLKHMQSAYTELCRALGNMFPANILSGCNLYQSGGTWWVNSGYIGLLGEVYTVDAHSTGLVDSNPAPKNNIYANVVETVESPSPVVYQNLVSRNVHFRRRIVFNTTPTLFNYASLPNYTDQILNTIYKTPVQLTLINDWTFGNNDVPNAHLKVEGKRVYLFGDIRFAGTGYVPSSGNPNLPFFIIPTELRSSYNHQFIVLSSNGWDNDAKVLTNGIQNAQSFGMATDWSDPGNLGPHAAWVVIKSNGECYTNPNASNMSICLDGISWPLP